jgi:nucleoid DNA-binding protein
MTWTELIRATAKRSGASVADTRRVLEALREETHAQLAKGERVTLHGLGTLDTRTRSARVLRSVQSGRRMFVGQRTQVVFRPSVGLVRRVQSDDEGWRDGAHQSAWRLAEALLSDLSLYHPDRVPAGVSGDDESVRGVCAASFGEPWARAQERFDEQVPAEVTASNDYLAAAVRSHWS